ncbi:MAG: hypothetical protein R3C28_16680 [Pirellulaceae bacterium]
MKRHHFSAYSKLLAIVFGISLALPYPSHGQMRIFDDFTDGDHADNSPLSWNLENWPGSSNVEISIKDSGLNISGQGGFPVFPTLDGRALITEDVSIRIQAQMTPEVYLAIYTRVSPPPNNAVYFGGVDQQGRIVSQEWDHAAQTVRYDMAIPSFALYDSDAFIQFDAIGDSLKVWVWPVDEEQPALPQLDTTDNSLTEGPNGIAFLSNSEVRDVSIRSFEMNVIRQNNPGDINGDGLVDVTDLNQVISDANTSDVYWLRSDTNGDFRVNTQDVHAWVKEITQTSIGDANLDGKFDSNDFVQVFTAGQYEDNIVANSTWDTGDWNGDQEFDTADFVAAFQDGGYESEANRVQSVPEPSINLLAIAFIMFVPARKIFGKKPV